MYDGTGFSSLTSVTKAQSVSFYLCLHLSPFFPPLVIKKSNARCHFSPEYLHSQMARVFSQSHQICTVPVSLPFDSLPLPLYSGSVLAPGCTHTWLRDHSASFMVSLAMCHRLSRSLDFANLLCFGASTLAFLSRSRVFSVVYPECHAQPTLVSLSK